MISYRMHQSVYHDNTTHVYINKNYINNKNLICNASNKILGKYINVGYHFHAKNNYFMTTNAWLY